MPEELVKPEELSKYRQVASHVVSGWVASNSETEPSVLSLGWGRQAWEEWVRSGRRAVRGPWPCFCRGL